MYSHRFWTDLEGVKQHLHENIFIILFVILMYIFEYCPPLQIYHYFNCNKLLVNKMVIQEQAETYGVVMSHSHYVCLHPKPLP